ncbi:allene oxide synthase-lipoxygenase protein-like isoform X5 [Dreissena polymorpha]|uniref:allene oxide synthase-lipoxygenase protein-like isoform X5 n=1 Tax=Dreissena polymorpha TaxID=45954 RepID=UPI0022652A41|nr:allene oxide synthase-lipoxygenase protein-like isoform X5 [Dreissena polymorpha]
MSSDALADYVVFVRTGDRKRAGTDANIRVILHGNTGLKTEKIHLHHVLKNDFECGQVDEFEIDNQRDVGTVEKIELWRDNFGLGSRWYCDYVIVKKKGQRSEFSFPIFRWIKADVHYMFRQNDTMLPQQDPMTEQRWKELKSKKKKYEVAQKFPNGPAQIKNMPADEAFSFDYKWDIVKRKLQLIATSKIVMFTAGRWESIQHLRNVYTKEVFCEPHGCTRWSNDLCFAGQRVASMNHSCIELCTKIPDKFGVTEELLKPYLEGQSLQKILDSKRMFIVDHTILAGLPCRKGFHSCVPMALFYVNNNKQLIPVAIQLNQDKGTDNPVFFPNDPPNVWMKAKMWFNNADANVHQSLTHLGFTHLLMEGVTVVTHRNLSQSHPVFKLLSPHFLYLIAINSRGLELLVSKNGWVDKTMNIGQEGMFALIARGIKKWRMNVEGTLPEDLKQRGVLDTNVLPGYHFRNDALLLYGAINKYVKKYVDLYYDSVDKITGDWEIQSWGAELTKEREKGGCGLEGVPSHGKFSSKEDLYLTLTSIIYTCSVAHASTNFPQYDEYAYPPNYPALLNGEPPKDKRPVEETELVSMLPDKPTTLDMMTVTKILSSRGTNSLGDFEVQYIFEPEACKVVDEFRADLAEISKVIKQRNKERNPPYPYLDPDIVPNSISI